MLAKYHSTVFRARETQPSASFPCLYKSLPLWRAAWAAEVSSSAMSVTVRDTASG